MVHDVRPQGHHLWESGRGKSEQHGRGGASKQARPAAQGMSNPNMQGCSTAVQVTLPDTQALRGALTCGWPGSWSCTAAHAFSETMTWPPCAASLQGTGVQAWHVSLHRRRRHASIHKHVSALSCLPARHSPSQAAIHCLKPAHHTRHANPPQLLHTLHSHPKVVGGHIVRSRLLARHAAGWQAKGVMCRSEHSTMCPVAL